jgi:plasmid stabilization system protein ParE
LSKKADNDIIKVYDYIKEALLAPDTAEKFLRGIFSSISNLETNAPVYAISTYQDVLCYGSNARSINYKGFTIIYTIHGYYVLVHRIIHGSLIKG